MVLELDISVLCQAEPAEQLCAMTAELSWHEDSVEKVLKFKGLLVRNTCYLSETKSHRPLPTSIIQNCQNHYFLGSPRTRSHQG